MLNINICFKKYFFYDMINFVIYVKLFNHTYELPSCFKFVYVCHFFMFLLFLNSLTFLYVHQSSISTVIVQVKQKKVTLERTKDIFSLKNSACIEYLSHLKHITDERLVILR